MKKWVKVEDVSRLRDGQRIRMYFGGTSYETAKTRYGGDGGFINSNQKKKEVEDGD